jgi:hypothetical protein
MSLNRRSLDPALSVQFRRVVRTMISQIHWFTTNNMFLAALAIICILAVIFNYQVSISPLGGFQFEPAGQLDLSRQQPPLNGFDQESESRRSARRGAEHRCAVAAKQSRVAPCTEPPL